jgi:plastocyanin
MKKTLLFYVLIFLSFPAFCTIHTITNIGNEYSPASITIAPGDTVVFLLSSEHDAREVSQETWNANSGVALPGGFQVPMGGGMLLPAQLTEGIHYFVCTPHAFLGMKGTITVQSATNTEEVMPPAISVYPNPASEYLLVKNHGSSTRFVITDVTGRQRLAGLLGGETPAVDVSSLASGMYFLLLGGKGEQRLKFIKE